MKQLLLDIQPPALPTLDNFVVGRNAEALNSLQLAVEGNIEPRFIYLWGPAGSGKSHLLAACSAVAEKNGLNLVCADDVHQLSAEAQIGLFNTSNRLKEVGGAMIAAGIASPSQMGLRAALENGKASGWERVW